MTTTRRILTAALLTLTAWLAGGCAPGGALYVDSRFTSEERLEIQGAADMWEAVGHPVDLVWDAKTTGRSTERRELVRAGHRAATGLSETFREDGVDGLQTDGRIVVDMDRVTELGDTFRAVVAHEMGHLIGLPHITGSDSLMGERHEPGSPMCITERDVRHMCAVLGCPGETPVGCDAGGAVVGSSAGK